MVSFHLHQADTLINRFRKCFNFDAQSCSPGFHSMDRYEDHVCRARTIVKTWIIDPHQFINKDLHVHLGLSENRVNLPNEIAI